ncbi:MAG: peptide chain release factor N(5)-glutamine methyltransferase [Alphaproteobacteria bacterium]|nr:peptide chain release factor N(5)-glutamine methyltransferase [Alphaproteobacteria bacterium]
MLVEAARRLTAAGIAGARLDARLLLAHALGVAPDEIMARRGDRPTEAVAVDFERLLVRRLAREPVSRIRGRREFWSLEFEIGPDTLDPRPDSETLIEAALACLADRGAPWRILDLGTGSGCLLLAMLSELPAATGVGIDRASGALAIAAANAHRLGLDRRCRFLCGDWAAGLAGRFDLIVANPPYIPSADIAALEPEVRDHDPVLALAGGVDGLDAYRAIAAELPRLLAVEGRAVLELGNGQAEPVAKIMVEAGLVLSAVRPDLAGVARALVVGC